MTLRCRKGDIAIVLRSHTGHEGKIVEVKEFIGYAETRDGTVFNDLWAISIGGVSHAPDGIPYGNSDRNLLPIRPGDLDETQEIEKELELAQ